MKNGKNGIILDSQTPYVSEVGVVYILSLLGGVVGLCISLFNGNSFLAAMLAGGFFYLAMLVIVDVTFGGIKLLSLQAKDYDLINNNISPEEIYEKIYHKVSPYGKLELVNRNLIFVKDGLRYYICIDYSKTNFSISITKRMSSFSPSNDLRTGRYNKAIIVIPMLVYAIQQAAMEK